MELSDLQRRITEEPVNEAVRTALMCGMGPDAFLQIVSECWYAEMSDMTRRHMERLWAMKEKK